MNMNTNKLVLRIARQLSPEMLRQESGTLDFHSGVSGLCLLLEQLVLLHFSPDESWCSRLYIAFVDCGIVVWCDETTLKLPADRHQFALQVENPLESGYGNRPSYCCKSRPDKVGGLYATSRTPPVQTMILVGWLADRRPEQSVLIGSLLHS